VSTLRRASTAFHSADTRFTRGAPAHAGRDNGNRVRAGNGARAEVGDLARVVEAVDKLGTVVAGVIPLS